MVVLFVQHHDCVSRLGTAPAKELELSILSEESLADNKLLLAILTARLTASLCLNWCCNDHMRRRIQCFSCIFHVAPLSTSFCVVYIVICFRKVSSTTFRKSTLDGLVPSDPIPF